MTSFAPAHNITIDVMTADTTAFASGAEPRAFVLLKSRRRLDLLNPDPHAWTDDDLAAGLSRTVRWGGASRWEHPLSVAQHSLTVLTIREADGALTELVFGSLPPTDDIEWPRLETDREIGVIGCARPLEDATRIAAHGLVRWVAELGGLSVQDAHELVSQTCRLRIGNLVNPLYSAAVFIDKRWLPGAPAAFGGAHGRLAGISR